MKRPVLILLLLLAGLVKTGWAADTNDWFAQGLVLARAGQFPDAAADFEKSAHRRPSVGALVNAGISEWQRGRAGEAILAWEQAQWINPFDARSGGNLKFARAVAQVDAPDLEWFETVSTWLPANAWVWFAGASLWLGIGLLILPGIFRRPRAGWHQALAAAAFGVFLLSLAANYGVVSRTGIGFVVKKNAALQLTPTTASEVISTLTAGEPARRLRARGNYFLIHTVSGLGWIERDNFGLVNPE